LANQYTDDRPLHALLRRLVPPDAHRAIEPELTHMGELAAGELLALASRHRNDLPTHEPYDAWGRRVDEVRPTPGWARCARLAAEQGLIGAGYERKHGPASRLHQFALVYLFERSSQSYTCPLAMSDGAARTLEMLAPPALRDRALPRLISRDPARA